MSNLPWLNSYMFIFLMILLMLSNLNSPLTCSFMKNNTSSFKKNQTSNDKQWTW